MPWIEPESGDVGHGVAGVPGSINNVQFGIGGVGGWPDENRVVYGGGEDNWIVSTYNKRTGQKQRVIFNDVSYNGEGFVQANGAVAGKGHVTCWRGGTDGSQGIYTTLSGWPRFQPSRDYQLPDSGLLGMGPDGAVGFKPLYQSNGPSRVRETDGSEWEITPGHASSLQMYGNRRVLWMDGPYIRVINLPQPQQLIEGGTWGGQAAFVTGDNRWWILYFNGSKGVVLHPFDSADMGFIIVPAGIDAWSVVKPHGLFTVRIAISRTQGEAPGDIYGYDVDVRNGRAIPLPFGAQDQTPLTFIWQELKPPPVTPVIPTFHFTHPVIVAPFKDPDGKSGATHEISVNNTGMSVDRPHFAAEDSLANLKGEMLGIYTEASADPANALRLAAAANTRVMVCHDTISPWIIPTEFLRDYDIPTTELYLDKSETLEQSKARWTREVKSLLSQWDGDLGVVPMFYCQGGAPPNEIWTVAQTCDAIAPLSDIVNLSPRIKVIAPFSYLRANGIVGHVELQQAWENLKQAGKAAGLAVLTPVGGKPVPPDPPKPTTPYPAATPYKARTV